NLLIDILELVLLGAESKIFDSVVGQHDDVACLLESRFELLEAGHLQIDIGKPIIGDAILVADSAKAQPGGIQWHVDRLVFSNECPISPATPTAVARRPGLRF